MFSCKGNQKFRVEKVQLSDSVDQQIFNSIRNLSKTRSLHLLSESERALELAKFFYKTPYVGGTLEKKGKEQLVVNLQELDCTTFLENVVVFSEITSASQISEANYLKQLEALRYRKGRVNGYLSRLHYFSDWIYENQKKGFVEDITSEIGGEILSKKIDFMSTHVDAYEALKQDTSLVQLIREKEKEINKRKLYYIPENRIEEIEKSVKSGDLIAITTKIKGLEISHVGIACQVNDRLHLIHASSKAKKVVLSEKPLVELLMANRLQTGIMVLRLK